MKARVLAAALALSTFAGPALADGNLNAFLGARPMKNEAYWKPLEDQGGLGVTVDLAMNPDLPVWWSVTGQYFGTDDGTKGNVAYTHVGTFEASLGLKLMPQVGTMRPYVGGGIVRDWVELQRNDDTLSDSAASRGYYAEAGALFRIGRHGNLGAYLRWITDTHVTLFGSKGDLDGRSFGIVGGYAWGGEPARHRDARP